MAWRRDEANLGISGATAYSYTECDWEVHGEYCSYRHIGGVTSPYGFNANATATAQWWESGTWHDYGSGSGTFNGYGDLKLFDITDTFARQAQDRLVSVGTTASMMGGSARSYIDYTVPHLAPAVTWASSNPVVRNSDNSITLTWNAPSLEYSAMCLEVSIDGGSWSQFAVLWNTATTYTWTECSADHSYQFRIRSNYLASYSAYDTCATVILMTPSMPKSISTAAAGGTNIDVTLDNPSPVATKVQYQISTDGGSNWGSLADAPSTTSFQVSASGTVKIRVRNYNATGVSDWLESGIIVTLCPPDPPTLISPSNSAVLTTGGSVTFQWRHNAPDGSAQTAAQLQYSTDGGSTWTTVTKSTEQSHTMANPWSAGTTVTWRVRTKGADASYGAYVQAFSFKVYSAPTVSITSPGATVTGMPVTVSANYTDASGTCQAATVTLTQGGRKLCSESATPGATITASIDVDEFLPTNGESYTVVVTARSSSSLSTTANTTFSVNFTEPVEGTLQVQNDPDTGYASLLATFDNSASEITYAGSTNEQYESSEGYVRSLTVEGKSEVQNGSLVSIEGVSVKGRNLLPKLTAGTYTNNGVTIVVDDDGVATMSGTTTASGNAVIIPFESPFVVTDGLYLQMNNSVANASAAPSFESNSAVSAFAPAFAPTNRIITVPSSAVGKTIERIRLWLSAGVTLSGTFAPMLSTSSTATAYEPYSLTTITTPLRSAGSVRDTLMADADSWTVERRIGVRSYQSGDESDPDVLTDGTTTYYELATPTQDPETSMSRIEIGSAFTVATDLDSTFSMTTWDGSADAVSVSVSRVNADGTVTPLLTDGQSGAGIVDKYAPLNTDYQYAITTKAVSQAVKTVYVTNRIDSLYWFAYWGENVAKAKWNPDNGGIQVTRPQKTRVYYAGRRDPVSYDGHAVALTETPSWMFLGKDEVDTFVRLIEDGGRGIYKSCDGWVYHADFDLTLTPSYTAIGYYGGASLGITRIAGELL